jgi:hypothetical protein
MRIKPRHPPVKCRLCSLSDDGKVPRQRSKDMHLEPYFVESHISKTLSHAGSCQKADLLLLDERLQRGMLYQRLSSLRTYYRRPDLVVDLICVTATTLA